MDVTMCIWGVAMYYLQEMDSWRGSYTIRKMTYPNLSKVKNTNFWCNVGKYISLKSCLERKTQTLHKMGTELFTLETCNQRIKGSKVCTIRHHDHKLESFEWPLL